AATSFLMPIWRACWANTSGRERLPAIRPSDSMESIIEKHLSLKGRDGNGGVAMLVMRCDMIKSRRNGTFESATAGDYSYTHFQSQRDCSGSLQEKDAGSMQPLTAALHT